MSEDGSFGVLELGKFLEEQAQLEDNLVKILFLRVIMRSKGFDSFVVLKNWIILLIVLQSDPALTEELLAQWSVQHNEVLDSAYHFLQLAITLTQK